MNIYKPPTLYYFKPPLIEMVGLTTFALITTLIMIFVYLLNFFINNKKQIKNLPPGPKPWPLLGSLPQMILNKQPPFRWIHELMDEMNTKIICIRLGKNVHVITISCPKIACEILKKNDSVFSTRPDTMATYLVTSGYLSTALVPMGSQWRKMKKLIISEVLSHKRHVWLHRKRDEEADNLVRYMYNCCSQGGGVVNVRLVGQQYCGNVTRKMIFGTRFFGEGKENGGPGKEEEEHVNALFAILEYIYAFCMTDYMQLLRWVVDFDGHERKVRKSLESVNKYHDPVIETRIRQWHEGERKEKQDLLDVLILLKDKSGNTLLSMNEIKVQITEFMLAAVDNPSNAIEWALAEMINKPETLKKATEELDRVVGRERLVQEPDLPQLNYVSACAREAFRLHPVSPFGLPHVSLEDVVIAGYNIPKGSHVLLSRIGLGRNPEVWKEPLRFDPERHLREDGQEVVLSDNELNMLSFSIGRRGCPGVVLGSSMTFMLFARLLQGFTWEAPQNESRIELTESKGNTHMAKPLFALAKPRLPANMYPNELIEY